MDAVGASISQIAKEMGVTDSAVKKWRANPRYRAEVARLVREHARALDRAVMARGAVGLNALVKVLSDPSAKPGEIASAAAALTSFALKISARTTEAEAKADAAAEEKANDVRPARNLTFTLTKPVLPETPS